MADFRNFSLAADDYNKIVNKLPSNPGSPPPPKKGVVVLSQYFDNTSAGFAPYLVASFALPQRRPHAPADTDKFQKLLTPFSHADIPDVVTIAEPFVFVDLNISLAKINALVRRLSGQQTFRALVLFQRSITEQMQVVLGGFPTILKLLIKRVVAVKA